jgi:Protein of unknown function (DUF1153)
MPSDVRKALHGVPSTLPPSAAIRWSAWRKVEVITAIRVGAITFSEACDRYWLSLEELTAWEAAFDEDGLAALQMKYRSMPQIARDPKDQPSALIEACAVGRET